MANSTVEKFERTLPEIDRSKHVHSLAKYYRLGKSGLKVSPLCFGTATFGQAWGPNWCTDKSAARQLMKRFLEAGGNFVDTANTYHEGESETITGELIRELTNRDQVIIATKFTFGTRMGDPNGGGNSRKHMYEAVENSLRRLGTDYIDMYWVHNWDTITPAEEVMSSLNALVQSGKVRYIGLSNPPAWYLGRAQTLAELRGWEKISAIQMEYSLAVRNIEFEYTDACLEMDIAICPWSPLANGLLSGKYKFDGKEFKGDGRVANSWVTDPDVNANAARLAPLVDGLVAIAKDLGKSPAQVALNWVTTRPGVVSSVIGASKLEQLEDNIKALEFQIPKELLEKLDKLSKPAVQYPYFFHTGDLNQVVNGVMHVEKHPSWYHKR